MDNKISIIIPTYNSSKYIKECLDSINIQNYDNYEVIIVDDGSIDGTVDIINEYVSLNNRFKLFIKENGGVSSARNYGLTKVTGDYILFVDSDDYLNDENVLDLLINNIKGFDVIRFNNYFNNNEITHINSLNLKDEYDNSVDFINDTLTNNKAYSWYLWQYLYKKELWNDIRFPEGKIFEDTSTIYKVLLKSNNIKVINEGLYVYRYNNESLSKKITYKICLDMLDVIETTINDINSLDIPYNTKELLLNNVSIGYISVVNALGFLNKEENNKLIKLLNDKKYLLDNCHYGNYSFIKNLINIFGVKFVSKLLNLRRKIK